MTRTRSNTITRTLFLTVGIAVAVFIGTYKAKNPEHLVLNDDVRKATPGNFVKLEDGYTHYDIAGPDSGQRVMLVHGFSVPSYIWDSTSAALSAAGFRVARYDYFGRGFSDRPDVAFNADLFDRQLSQLLDSLHWTAPVDIVGLSMGGPVTATFAGRHPERVRSLTLVDPAAGARSDVPGMFRIPLVGPMLWQIMAVPGMADGQLGDFVEPTKWPDWPGRYRTQMQYRGFGRSLLSTLREGASVSLDSVYARVGRLGIPTLLLWGKDDQTVPFAQAAGVQRAIPQAEFHAVDHAGHLPHMERADFVNPILIHFLQMAKPGASDTTHSTRSTTPSE